MIVFDLDPGPPANIVQCAQVGLWVREVFDHFGLQSFPKTSGSKGLQIYVPLNTKTTYEQTKAFAHALARLLEHEHPELVVSDMKKAVRTNKVFVDWSKNDQHKTSISVYSLRAREHPSRVFFLQRLLDFFPGDRRGHSRMLPRAQRVNRDRRLVLVVLAPVDEHFIGAHRLFHIRDNQFGMLMFEQTRQRVRECLRLLVRRFCIQWNVNLKALRSRRLGETLQPKVIEDLTHPEANLRALNNICGRSRIEIEDNHGGHCDVGR